MNYVTVLFRSTAKPGHEATVRRELTAVITPTRLEPDCVSYELHIDEGNPACFTCYEQWASSEGFQRQLDSSHIQKLANVIWPLLQESPEEAIIRLNPIRPL